MDDESGEPTVMLDKMSTVELRRSVGLLFTGTAK